MKIFDNLADIPVDIADATEYWSTHLGFFVIPLDVARKKRPMIQWRVDRTPPKLDSLIKKARQGGGIGIRLPKNLVVVDLDVDKAKTPSDPEFSLGLNNLTSMMVDEDPSVLDTVCVLTPSGGHHLYYSSPIGETNTGIIGEGIDLRAGPTGIVVVPPSYGTNFKGRYEFDPSCEEVRYMPSFLGKRLVQRKRSGQLASYFQNGSFPKPTISDKTSSLGAAIMAKCCAKILHAAPGTRNHTMYSQAFVVYRLVGAGLVAPDDADSNLLDVSIQRSMKSGKGSDIDATLASAKNNGINKPYSKSQIDMWTKQFNMEQAAQEKAENPT